MTLHETNNEEFSPTAEQRVLVEYLSKESGDAKVVVQGPVGSGKTTTAYLLCSMLLRKGELILVLGPSPLLHVYERMFSRSELPCKVERWDEAHIAMMTDAREASPAALAPKQGMVLVDFHCLLRSWPREFLALVPFTFVLVEELDMLQCQGGLAGLKSLLTSLRPRQVLALTLGIDLTRTLEEWGFLVQQWRGREKGQEISWGTLNYSRSSREVLFLAELQAFSMNLRHDPAFVIL